jgi:heme-degrading monooxygenase HmoA
MLVAIIEYALNDDVETEFHALLGTLLPAVGAVDGFLGADAAASIGRAGCLYEISYWRDHAALASWARHPEHALAKARGRQRLLKWYRIRVAAIERDWAFGPVPDGSATATAGDGSGSTGSPAPSALNTATV